MKFTCDNFYSTIKDTFANPQRKIIYDNKKELLEDLETKAFDLYNVEEIYIINEFFDKDKYVISRLPIYMEMDKKQFESFVESKDIELLKEDFDLIIKSNNNVYNYNNGFWKTGEKEVIKRELWK